MATTLTVVVSVAATSLGLVARIAYIRASGAVDHYYWIQVARAFRSRKRPPAVLPGKYLLEDERQYYPPLFGQLLSLFPDRFLLSRWSLVLPVAVDMATLCITLAIAHHLGIGRIGLLVIAATYICAPVLIAYNYQLTSRGLGNLFLTVALCAQIVAAQAGGVSSTAWWAISAVAIAAVISTHKMTTQFLIVLLPVWMLTLTTGEIRWEVPLCALAGLAIATGYTGAGFQRMQWCAHADIVAFWGRNWRWLGAHQFDDSPIYGSQRPQSPGLLHQPGVRGIAKHGSTLLAYLPTAFALTVLLPWASAPSYVIAWVIAALAMAAATLFLPPLRQFGGGHLYIFNAVVPVALWWGDALSEPQLVPATVFMLTVVIGFAGLVAGLRRRNARVTASDPLADVIQRLNELPAGRVAVFPFTAADRVALETPHAVLWGAHSISFAALEPYFPVMRGTLSAVLVENRIDTIAIDVSWWPSMMSVIEPDLPIAQWEQFGTWRYGQVVR